VKKETKKKAATGAAGEPGSPRVGTANLGFPRIGPDRELKRALEGYWRGELGEKTLLETARSLRKAGWQAQKAAGVEMIPSNDFSLYDHMLDMICLVGAIPERFGPSGGSVSLDTYFAMARGTRKMAGPSAAAVSAHAMEMTKWLDTNYHYIVPELHKGMKFRVSSTKVLDEYQEASGLGFQTRPVLVGPASFLSFGKCRGEKFDVFSLLDGLLPVYVDTLEALRKLGAEWVQMDEPVLVLEAREEVREAVRRTYETLAREVPGIKICLTTYFDALDDNLDLAMGLPVAALHVDLVRGPQQLTRLLDSAPASLGLSLGLIDGRNIWKNDISQTLRNLREVFSERAFRRVWIAPSCSLIHVPLDLALETELDPEVKSWMSYAKQKLEEVQIVRTALVKGDKAVLTRLEANRKAMDARRRSSRTRVAAVRARAADVRTRDMTRGALGRRREVQRERLGLPLFPTTTIGSFPQTPEVRRGRKAFKNGEMSEADYRSFMRAQIWDAVRRQEDLGLDVLVHGEFERNDMVEYFGERLEGFAFTRRGWVQSYGSRCVKPPVIFGDVSRPGPITVEWFRYAQSLTKKPMKAMLTGPVTLLQWSFVRNDQPRSETALQIAFAIRDEVSDLEKAGARVIQIDEAAFREGLPLKKTAWQDHLRWAVRAFRLCSSSVKDETQVHTHMCYSEFNDILDAIADMNADVISIETSRSQMELLDAFARFSYPADIGPGVYDIHSPRVPDAEEMKRLLEKALRVLPQDRIWVNPDCGLKTRGWDETLPALRAMVQAARSMREAAGKKRFAKPRRAAEVG
jgi:5-methyltetrahydropteroyltriglutamate--homocysteine methyltransferase